MDNRGTYSRDICCRTITGTRQRHAGLQAVKLRSLAKVLLLWVLVQALASAQEITFRILADDGEPAGVSVENKLLGSTGEDLIFDISAYQRPVFLDVVLSRPGFLPTLHSLQVDEHNGRWQPGPLGLCRPVNPIRLRTEPEAKIIYREKRNGQLSPGGQDSLLLLSAGPLPPRQAFVAKEVTVVLESPGYQPKRVVLPAAVWFADSYPAEGEAPLVLEPAYGLQAWWKRTGSQNLGVLLLFTLLALLLVAALRLPFFLSKAD